jgi:hypothetical protein
LPGCAGARSRSGDRPSRGRGALSRHIRIREARSGLDASFLLLAAETPACSAFLWGFLDQPCEVPAIHAMWTGPEISCPVPAAMVADPALRKPLPQENATITPQAGELVLSYVPPFRSRGNPEPVFDLGVFYAPGGRMLFPAGWIAGSVVARCVPDTVPALAAACATIRRAGACTVEFSRAGE